MWYGQASYLQSIIPERDHLLSFAEMKVEQMFLKTVRTIPISKPMVDAKGQLKPFPSERRNAIAFAESIKTASGQTNFLARELSPKVELLHALLAPNGISVQGLTACVSKLQEYEALDEKDRSGGALVDFIFLQPLGKASWGAAQKFYETLEATIMVQTKVDTVLDKMKKLGARNSFTVSDQSVPLLDDLRETVSDAHELLTRKKTEFGSWVLDSSQREQLNAGMESCFKDFKEHLTEAMTTTITTALQKVTHAIANNGQCSIDEEETTSLINLGAK